MIVILRYFQADWRRYRAVSYYKKLKTASAISQCTWRRTAGKEHSNVKMVGINIR
jgi:myosin-5